MDKINMLAVYGYVGLCWSVSECGETSLASWLLVAVKIVDDVFFLVCLQQAGLCTINIKYAN